MSRSLPKYRVCQSLSPACPSSNARSPGIVRMRAGGSPSPSPNRGGLAPDSDAQAEVEYFPWRHFGFSLRYDYNDVDLEFERSRFDGKVDLENRGPQPVATVRFRVITPAAATPGGTVRIGEREWSCMSCTSSPSSPRP